MTDELKPCPFCGCEAEHLPPERSKLYKRLVYGTHCINAGCVAFDIKPHFFKQEVADVVWNRRAAPENKPLTCDGCENQKRDGFNYEVCVHCKRHWPDHYAHKPEGSETP